MKNTENYGLKKPESTDFYNVDDFNDNMDVIDSKLKEIEESVGQSGDVVDNLESTSTDLSLSANQGRVLNEKITGLNDSLGGNNLIYNESEDAYYIQHGADSVLKKLGNANYTLKCTAKGIMEEYYVEQKSVSFTATFTVTIKNGKATVSNLKANNSSTLYAADLGRYQARITSITINSIVSN